MAENRQKYQKVKKVGSGMPSYGYLVYVKVYARCKYGILYHKLIDVVCC